MCNYFFAINDLGNGGYLRLVLNKQTPTHKGVPKTILRELVMKWWTAFEYLIISFPASQSQPHCITVSALEHHSLTIRTFQSQSFTTPVSPSGHLSLSFRHHNVIIGRLALYLNLRRVMWLLWQVFPFERIMSGVVSAGYPLLGSQSVSVGRVIKAGVVCV